MQHEYNKDGHNFQTHVIELGAVFFGPMHYSVGWALSARCAHHFETKTRAPCLFNRLRVFFLCSDIVGQDAVCQKIWCVFDLASTIVWIMFIAFVGCPTRWWELTPYKCCFFCVQTFLSMSRCLLFRGLEFGWRKMCKLIGFRSIPRIVLI